MVLQWQQMEQQPITRGTLDEYKEWTWLVLRTVNNSIETIRSAAGAEGDVDPIVLQRLRKTLERHMSVIFSKLAQSS